MNIASKIARYQLLFGLIGSAAFFVKGTEAMLAALCGGSIAAVLTWYAGVKMFAVASSDPQVQVMNFYRAMARKIVLAVVLFGVAVFVFGVFGHQFMPLIVTFAASLSVYWLALLWNIRNG